MYFFFQVNIYTLFCKTKSKKKSCISNILTLINFCNLLVQII